MEVQGSKMLGVKIIEVNTDNGCEETIGICELCMGTMYCDNPVITIEFPNGITDSFDGYYWDWDWYYELNINNYLNPSNTHQKNQFFHLGTLLLLLDYHNT